MKKIFILTGEPSGDKLASKVIHFEIDDMLISEDLQMIAFNICFQWIIKLKSDIFDGPKNLLPLVESISL